MVCASLASAAALVTPVVARATTTVNEQYSRPASGVFTLRGHGWGHGHGLSQEGGQGAATLGKTADEITSTYYPGTTRTTLAGAPIRVLIGADDHTDTRVLASSGMYATDLATHAKITLPSGPSQWRITVDGAGLHLSSLTGSTWTALNGTAYAGPLRFVAGSSGLVRLVLPGGSSVDYREAVQAVKTSATSLSTLAVMSMEHYLLGVVPRESLSSWKPAALQAQAIAARSYAAYERAHAGSRSYDICDSTQCQVFGGTAKYTSSGTRTALEPASTTQAVQATAGVVRSYNGGAIFAQFSASNGGWSTDGGLPYLVAKADPWDGVTNSSIHSWTASLPVSAIESRFPSLGSFRTLTVTQRDGNGEWGGRVLKVTLTGVDSAGNATQVETTGAGIYYALPWNGSNSGLRSTWFYVVPEYAATVASRSGNTTVVLPPGSSTATLTATLTNTGNAGWPASGLHLAVASPAGSADPFVGGSTTPGAYTGSATTVNPGDTATFAIPLDSAGRSPGTYVKSYRLRIGTASLFGPTLTWSVVVKAPVFTAVAGAPPSLVSTTWAPASGAPPALFADARTVVVPRAGSTTLRLTATNTGNLSWPVGSGSPFVLGTSAPRDRQSPSSGSTWASSARAAQLAGPGPVGPGASGTFDLVLNGNNRPAGVSTEAFDPLWEGQSWLSGDTTSLSVVRVDTAVSRAAVTDLAPASGFSLVNAPNGTRTLVVRLRNVGNDPWAVGTEQLGTTAAAPLAKGWPSSTRTPALVANRTRPGQSSVFPGEVGEWRVPLSAYKHAAGSYSMVLRAVGPSGFYGPSFTVTTKVVQASFTFSLVSVKPTVAVPHAGGAWTAFYVKNTGNVAWPVGGALRSTVLATSSPSRASSWYSARRPGSLSSNYSRPGATVVLPGQVARFSVYLAGNRRAPSSTVRSEGFGMSWDGWKGTTLRATLTYRIV